MMARLGNRFGLVAALFLLLSMLAPVVPSIAAGDLATPVIEPETVADEREQNSDATQSENVGEFQAFDIVSGDDTGAGTEPSNDFFPETQLIPDWWEHSICVKVYTGPHDEVGRYEEFASFEDARESGYFDYGWLPGGQLVIGPRAGAEIVECRSTNPGDIFDPDDLIVVCMVGIGWQQTYEGTVTDLSERLIVNFDPETGIVTLPGSNHWGTCSSEGPIDPPPGWQQVPSWGTQIPYCSNGENLTGAADDFAAMGMMVIVIPEPNFNILIDWSTAPDGITPGECTGPVDPADLPEGWQDVNGLPADTVINYCREGQDESATIEQIMDGQVPGMWLHQQVSTNLSALPWPEFLPDIVRGECADPVTPEPTDEVTPEPTTPVVTETPVTPDPTEEATEIPVVTEPATETVVPTDEVTPIPTDEVTPEPTNKVTPEPTTPAGTETTVATESAASTTPGDGGNNHGNATNGDGTTTSASNQASSAGVGTLPDTGAGNVNGTTSLFLALSLLGMAMVCAGAVLRVRSRA